MTLKDHRAQFLTLTWRPWWPVSAWGSSPLGGCQGGNPVPLRLDLPHLRHLRQKTHYEFCISEKKKKGLDLYGKQKLSELSVLFWFQTFRALAECVGLHSEGSAEAFPVSEAGRFGLLGGTLLDGVCVTRQLLHCHHRRSWIRKANTLK